MSVAVATLDIPRRMITMATDSLVTEGNVAKEVMVKAGNQGEYLLAWVGDMGTVTQLLDNLPEVSAGGAVQLLARRIRNARRRKKRLGSLGKPLDVTFLVASPGGLVEVGGDGVVLRLEKDYAAIGSGAEVALGAMHALYTWHGELEGVAEAGVRAAIEHADGCGGKVRVLVL